MKTFRLLLAGGAALAVLASCQNKDLEETTTYDDAYYAASASISSDSSYFTATDDGGEVDFWTTGGDVVINVSCGTNWVASNSDDSWLSLTYGSGTLTLSCGQNTEELQLTATVTLSTATDGIRFATIYVTQNAYGAPEISVETTTWHAPAAGELSVEIAVNATTSWTAETDASWLTAEAGADVLTLTAAANEDAEERTAEVTLTASDGIQSSTATLTVTQDAAAYVALDKEKVSVLDSGDSASVGVESNYDWTYATEADWFTVEQTSEGLTVTATSDYEGDEAREAVVTVTAGDGAENTAEASFTVSQYGAGSKALILVYKTTGSDNTVALPITGTVDCTVDWGDGSEAESVTSEYATHTYANAGEYDVMITGTATALNSNKAGTNCRNYITGVKQWGLTGLTDMSYAFYNCTSLSSIPTDEIGSFRDVITFSYAFQSAVIEEIPEGLLDYCVNAETMSYIFYKCSITAIPDRLFANCSAATTLSGAFRSCTSLTSLPVTLFEGLTDVTSLSQAFYGCTALETVPAGLFDPLRDCEATFASVLYGCTGLTSLPEGLFKDFSKATSFASAFYGCTGLTELPSKLFSGCSASTTFGQVFQGCSALKTIPADIFEGCTSATALNAIFYRCTALESIPEGLLKDCVPENLENCFGYDTTLTELPADLFSSGGNATDFLQAFIGCTGLTSLPAGLFDACIVVTNFKQTFSGCTALTGESPYTVVNGAKVHLYERSADVGFATPLTTSFCFQNCTGLSDYDDITSAGWN